jgi:uncharacterized protein DUF7019
MARWFWYLSPQKLGILKKPTKGWGFLTQRLKTLEIQAGVPWAQLNSKATPDTSLIRSLEAVEREIRRDHDVLRAEALFDKQTPIFFEFECDAGRLILRESYKGQEGECVFLMAGIENKTGIILLGSAANIIGSDSPRPRFVNPSIDPVGALLVLIDTEVGAVGLNGYSRAGIARDAHGLSAEQRVLYSFTSALHEIRQHAILQRVRGLAVFTASVSWQGHRKLNGVDVQDVEHVVVGSPIYVEQLSMRDSTNLSVTKRHGILKLFCKIKGDHSGAGVNLDS